jgi:putative ABC transport system permease protein
MIRNYFKTAWRNFKNNKLYSAINVTGLATGLAVGILILFWVHDELSYDSFHRNAADIYKINSHFFTGPSAQVWEGAPAPLSVLSKQIPEVVNTVRINEIDQSLLFKYGDHKFNESNLAFVDSTFFSVFDFKLLEGDAKKPFANLNSIVITLSEARKYFGNTEPVGKIVETAQGNFTVTGVVQNFPENSTFRYKMLLPMSWYAREFASSGGKQWMRISATTIFTSTYNSRKGPPRQL